MTIPFLDRYSTEARVVPASALVLPPAISILALYRPARDLTSISLVATAAAVVIVILSHVVRSRGRAAEALLFRRWGGAPTTRALRFRHSENRAEVARLHDTMYSATGLQLPDIVNERRDPLAADKVYERAVAALRELTRGADQFRVVLAENAAYGMRRNLWAVRDWGRTVTGIGAAAGIPAMVLFSGEVGTGAGTATVVLNVLSFAFWQSTVSERWVQEAAEAYSDALFRAAVALPARAAG